MKTKSLMYILSLVLFISITRAQINFGVKLNTGASFLYTKEYTSQPELSETKNLPFFTGQAGVYYNHTIAKKIVVGTELLFIPVTGKEYLKLYFTTGNGIKSGEYAESYFFRYILTGSIPVYFGYNFNKLNVNFGMQLHYAIASGGKEKGSAIYQGTHYKYSNKADFLNINKWDYGLRLGFIYKLNERFSADANLYGGMTNLIKDKKLSDFWVWRSFLCMAGIRYHFFRQE